MSEKSQTAIHKKDFAFAQEDRVNIPLEGWLVDTQKQCSQCGVRYDSHIVPVFDNEEGKSNHETLIIGYQDVLVCPECGARVQGSSGEGTYYCVPFRPQAVVED